MKKIVLSIIAILSSMLALSMQAQDKQYTLDVHDFTEIKVIDGVNVVYTTSADSAGYVRFVCDPKMAPHIMFTNDKNSLKIQVDYEEIPYGPLPTIYASSSSLLKAENSGDSTLTVSGLKHVNTFNAKIIGNGSLTVNDVNADYVNASISTGSGHLVISGHADRVKLSNVGTGPLEANQLDCKEAKCVLVGTGPIDCHVTEELKVIGAGSGTVYYSGNPKKVVNRTIGVKAKAIE